MYAEVLALLLMNPKIKEDVAWRTEQLKTLIKATLVSQKKKTHYLRNTLIQWVQFILSAFRKCCGFFRHILFGFFAFSFVGISFLLHYHIFIYYYYHLVLLFFAVFFLLIFIWRRMFLFWFSFVYFFLFNILLLQCFSFFYIFFKRIMLSFL